MSVQQRCYPTDEQAAKMVVHCGHARFVWNLALGQADLHRSFGRYHAHKSWTRELAEARSEFEWLGDGASVVQQQALRDLEQAFKNWWSNPGHFGRPTFRQRGLHEGFRVVNLQVRRINRKWAEAQVPKVGWVRFRLTRSWASVAAAKSVRFKFTPAGEWTVTFPSPQPAFERTRTGAIVGLDFGVANTITTSDDQHYQAPTLSPGRQQRLRRLERQRARQVKGSNRSKVTKLKIARLRAREARMVKDWIEKLTTELVRDHDVIGIEDLNVRGMTRSARGTVAEPGKNVSQKRGLNRAIQSQRWGLIRQRLEQKSAAATDPVTLVAVNPAGTSQRCNKCGHIDPKNRESQAVFECQSCGHIAHADVNAGRNIRDEATASLKAAGHAVTGRRGTPPSSGPMKRQLPAA